MRFAGTKYKNKPKASKNHGSNFEKKLIKTIAAHLRKQRKQE